MAYFPCKSEGGSGGKLGHSNMVHYSKTEDIKVASKKRRRAEWRFLKKKIREGRYDG